MWAFMAIVFSLTLFLAVPQSAHAVNKNWQIDDYKESLSGIERSPALIAAIDHAIDTLPKGTTLKTEIDLYLWKLVVLAKTQESDAAAELASEIYNKYDRKDYESERHFGATMFQIIESLAKTEQLDVSYDIIRHLRVNVYENPNDYLSYIIDQALIEVYIETYDYKRALDIALSVLYNPDYQSIPDIRNNRLSTINEIAFLYNRLGDGENALTYLQDAAELFEASNLTPKKLLKARTRSSGNHARSYLLLGEYEKAAEMADKALEGAIILDEDYMLALGYRLTGSIAIQKGNYNEALTLLEAGIDIAISDKLVVMKRPLFKEYSRALEKVGRHKEALEWQKRLYELERDVHESLIATRARLNDVEFEALRSHQELVKLRKENEVQREIAESDKNVQKLLIITIISLLAGGGFLMCLMVYMRKSQKKLLESENKAKIANQAKSDFLATMSHEIRTPMNGVMGMAQILQRTPLSEQQKFYVNIMSRSGENLLAIINDILDFSKIEADKLSLNNHVCNIDQTMQHIVSLLTPRAEDKSLKINYNYAPNLVKNFMVDRHRLSQIMTNLVGNAIKFTSEGEIKIDVSGTVDIENKRSQIQIKVTDNGIGIPREKLDVIFEKFTQAETSTTRKYGGTGLGLAISHKLVTAMNGTLSVTSIVDKGSEFTIDFPLDIAPITEDSDDTYKTEKPVTPVFKNRAMPPKQTRNNVQNVSKNKQTQNTQKGSFRFLVVEDDPINQTVIKSMLSHPKINISIAENGEDAVKAFGAHKFDIILMDVSMPVMDGVTATKIIRQKEAARNLTRTPIICLTAHAMAKQKQEFMDAGMDDYLPKPIDKKKLLNTILMWLNDQKNAA